MIGKAHPSAFDYLGIRPSRFTDVAGLMRVIAAAQRTEIVSDLFLRTIVKFKNYLHFFRGGHFYLTIQNNTNFKYYKYFNYYLDTKL